MEFAATAESESQGLMRGVMDGIRCMVDGMEEAG
jgi:hypothetical protein